jgi:hypothetical protein
VSPSGLPRIALSLPLVAASLGCASPPPAPKAPEKDPAAAFLDDMKPLRFHSARFVLSVPFPDGHTWRIDDHHSPLLVATHAPTAATLTVGLWGEPELMNRQRCEASARTRGLVKDLDLQTVADEVILGPGLYDSHVTIAALPSNAPHQTLSGHAFLFGSHIRKCLFVHYETRAREGDTEATLSARLAVARLQILGGIKVDVFDAPEMPRR